MPGASARILCLVAIAGGRALPAQEHGNAPASGTASGSGTAPASGIVALLRDPSGAPVPQANGWLATEPTHWLGALPALPPAKATLLPARRELHAVSDAHGVLRFVAPPGERALGAGRGMVATDGLGALLPRLHANRATRLVLTPLAEVTTPTGSETFTLWARARLPDGARIPLPPLAGTAVRLPAADYEVFAETDDGWLWQQLTLQSGHRSVLALDGPAQRLTLAADTLVHPSDWPELALGERAFVLRGGALAAPLTSWLGPAHAGRVVGPRVVPGPARRDALAWPELAVPAADEPGGGRDHFRLADDAPAAAMLFALTATDRGDYRVVAACAARGRTFELPSAEPGDTWLLLLAADRAPNAWPRSLVPDGSALGCNPGVELEVDLRDATGLPAVDVLVDYVPRGFEAAAVVARTDASGRASLGRVLGPGVLCISDPSCANERIALDRVPIEPLRATVAPGAECAGRATFAADAADHAGATIVVTLRDPRGLLRPAQRSVVAEPDGAFAFGGLPDDGAFVVTAVAHLGGHTWSARRVVRPGERDLALTLFDEDPTLTPPTGK